MLNCERVLLVSGSHDFGHIVLAVLERRVRVDGKSSYVAGLVVV